MVHRIPALSALLSLLIVTCCAQNNDLDTLIRDIFNTDKANQIPELNPQPQTTTTTTTTTTETPWLIPPNNPPPTAPIPAVVPNKSCGLQKECVKRINCNNGVINTDGTGLIGIRIDSEQDCGYMRICCQHPDITSTPIIPILPPEPHVGCGYQNPDGVGYKLDGNHDNEAQFAEFPWMVAILKEESYGNQVLSMYECGGALIAPTVVLTASHCVQTRTPSELVVRAGEWDTQTQDEILPYQDRRVREIVVHEKYNKGALHNDIALLFVEEPFVWEENVRPICLPDSNVRFDGSRCFATGWGKNKFGKEGTYQVFLKKIDLPIVSNDLCQTNLRTTRLGEYFRLHESFICAGGEKDKDTCNGDGGSPLVCPIPGVKNRFYQAGIVAWGIGCGEENIPGVYGNVPHLRQWVDDKLRSRGIDFTHFTA